MKTTQINAQLTHEVAADAGRDVESTQEQDIRRLQDLEMVLVGGGSDGAVVW